MLNILIRGFCGCSLLPLPSPWFLKLSCFVFFPTPTDLRIVAHSGYNGSLTARKMAGERGRVGVVYLLGSGIGVGGRNLSGLKTNKKTLEYTSIDRWFLNF